MSDTTHDDRQAPTDVETEHFALSQVGKTRDSNRLTPEEVESLREEMLRDEKKMAAYLASSPRAKALRAALRREGDQSRELGNVDESEGTSDAPPGPRGR